MLRGCALGMSTHGAVKKASRLRPLAIPSAQRAASTFYAPQPTAILTHSPPQQRRRAMEEPVEAPEENMPAAAAAEPTPPQPPAPSSPDEPEGEGGATVTPPPPPPPPPPASPAPPRPELLKVLFTC